MNGPQDLGGLHGFGPVVADSDDDHFHAAWERRVFALTLAMGATGAWNIDQSRSARESIGHLNYRQSSYFQIWHAGLLALLLERDLVSKEELATGTALTPAVSVPRFLRPQDVGPSLLRGSPASRDTSELALFAVGDSVQTFNWQPATHTRLPAYIRGQPGEIAAVHGAHVLPDVHGTSGADQAQWLYSVRFDPVILFGPDTTAHAIYVDCWESYLGTPDASGA